MKRKFAALFFLVSLIMLWCFSNALADTNIHNGDDAITLLRNDGILDIICAGSEKFENALKDVLTKGNTALGSTHYYSQNGGGDGQCWGFANAVTNKLGRFGAPGTEKGRTDKSIPLRGVPNSETNNTKLVYDTFYDTFKAAGVPQRGITLIRTAPPNTKYYDTISDSAGHSMVLLYYDQNYVYYLDGNSSDMAKEGRKDRHAGQNALRKLTWEEWYKKEIVYKGNRKIKYTVFFSEKKFAEMYPDSWLNFTKIDRSYYITNKSINFYSVPDDSSEVQKVKAGVGVIINWIHNNKQWYKTADGFCIKASDMKRLTYQSSAPEIGEYELVDDSLDFYAYQTKYPAGVYLKDEPYADAKNMVEVEHNELLHIKGLYKNNYNNYWVSVEKDNRLFYICANNISMVGDNESININQESYPQGIITKPGTLPFGNLPEGKSFPLKGIVTCQTSVCQYKILTAQAYVYDVNKEVLINLRFPEPEKETKIASINAKSFNINTSTLNNSSEEGGISFAKLKPGLKIFKLKITYAAWHDITNEKENPIIERTAYLLSGFTIGDENTLPAIPKDDSPNSNIYTVVARMVYGGNYFDDDPSNPKPENSIPTIVSQPQDMIVEVGETATFTVEATNAISYQWYYRTSSTAAWEKVNGNNTSHAYSLIAEEKQDGHQYRCLVENSLGTVYSEIATLTVLPNGDQIGEKCGDNLTWTLDDNGILVISGTGAMYNYDQATNTPPWQNMMDQIEEIIFQQGATSIGDYAFYHCYNMTNVTIPSNLQSIGDWAFYACNSLTNITIPDSVTTIGKSAFLHSQGLTSIAIPANVTQIGDNAFAGCRKMTAINVTADNRNYCSIDGVLFNKAKTELIRYPSGRQGEYSVPEGVTTIANTAFYVTPNLTKVTLPESVTNIGRDAFSDCYNLSNATILNKTAQIGEKAFYVYLDANEHWNDKVTVYCYADSTAHKYAVENNIKYSLLSSDPTVTEAPQTDLYFTYSGEGQDYVKTSNENKEFSVKRAVEDEKTFSLFTGIQVDGKNVDRSNYEATAGSVVIKLKAPYLETLTVGDHVMTVLFTDGKNDIPFTVSAAETPVKPTDPTKFADVAVPSDSFTFKKVWQGDHEDSIDFTLYKADGSVYHHGFDKRVVSKTEWRYNAYFSAPTACYVIEKPVPGYQIKYVNVGVYADVTDRCCDGGTIINKKVPKTGDAADFALWAGIIALGVVGLTTTVILTKRKKAHK